MRSRPSSLKKKNLSWQNCKYFSSFPARLNQTVSPTLAQRLGCSDVGVRSLLVELALITTFLSSLSSERHLARKSGSISGSWQSARTSWTWCCWHRLWDFGSLIPIFGSQFSQLKGYDYMHHTGQIFLLLREAVAVPLPVTWVCCDVLTSDLYTNIRKTKRKKAWGSSAAWMRCYDLCCDGINLQF